MPMGICSRDILSLARLMGGADSSAPMGLSSMENGNTHRLVNN